MFDRDELARVYLWNHPDYNLIKNGIEDLKIDCDEISRIPMGTYPAQKGSVCGLINNALGGSFTMEVDMDMKTCKGLVDRKVVSKYDLTPTKIIVNYPATIVFWPDKTKTVVKCAEDDEYDVYDAFTAALAKKIFGSNSGIKKMIEKVTEGHSPVKNGISPEAAAMIREIQKKIGTDEEPTIVETLLDNLIEKWKNILNPRSEEEAKDEDK